MEKKNQWVLYVDFPVWLGIFFEKIDPLCLPPHERPEETRGGVLFLVEEEEDDG